MKTLLTSCVCIMMLISGCSSICTVNVTPQSRTEKTDLKTVLEHFYRSHNFINWREDERRSEWQDYILQDESLEDIWLENKGPERHGWFDFAYNEIISFESETQGVYSIRLVFQKGPREYEAEERACELSEKLEEILLSEFPNSKVEAWVRTAPDLR